MTPTARKIPGMFKPDYDGPKPVGRLTTPERAQVAQPSFMQRKDNLVRRLHDAMLVMSTIDVPRGGGGGWPAYVHDFEDMIGREVEPTRPARFDPTPAQLTDLLAALALLDGLLPVFLKVLYLRAIGEFHGGFSFAEIGDRYGRSDTWAMGAYEAVIIQAGRRSGLLDAEPRGHAVLVCGVQNAGYRCLLTTAADPAKQLRTVRSISPIPLNDAFALWTPGPPTAKHLVKEARKWLLGATPPEGSWHRIGADDMADNLVRLCREHKIAWSLEKLDVRGRAASIAADELDRPAR